MLAILGAIGGALVLAGVCLVISANWEAINAFWKIAGVMLLMVGAHVAGWRLGKDPGHHPRLGDVAFGLGAGFFLAGIALVSQIYHLDARPAGYVLCGWLGIAAVPWIVGSRSAQALSLATGLVWFALETTTRSGWLRLGDDDEFWKLTALAVPVGIAVWCSGLALRRTGFSRFASLHEGVGVLLTCVALYLLGFLRHDWRAGSEASMIPAEPMAVVSLLLMLALVAAWRRAAVELKPLLVWFALALIPVAGVAAGWNLHDGGWLWSGLSWMALFALNIAMIRTGLAFGRVAWVNFAVPCIGLNVFTRYFDLFGTMLEGGVFFVVTGTVMLAVVYYLERKRRGLVAALRSSACGGEDS
jgi:hypothetical protein